MTGFPGLMVCGDRSGSGKSTACLALLHLIVTKCGFDASEVAYIKPATQCEDVTLVAKYCKSKGIQCRGIGPVRFQQGVSYEMIEHPSTQLLDRAEAACRDIAVGKKFVLVDGVGYSAVGTCCGVSNAQIAERLGISVVLIGKSGVGDAIDSMMLHLAFLQNMHKVRVAAMIFNKLPQPSADSENTDEQKERHSYENCVKYVGKFMQDHFPEVEILGFLEKVESLMEEKDGGLKSNRICALKETEESLKMNDTDMLLIKQIEQLADRRINVEKLLHILLKSRLIL